MDRSGFRVVLVCSLMLFGACGGDSAPPSTEPDPPAPVVPRATSVAVQAGADQVALGGTATPVAPAVIVRDAQGNPFPGASVQFAVAEGGGTVEGASQQSDASGVARVTRWTLGDSGPQRLTATVATLTPVSINATAVPLTAVLTQPVPTGGGVITVSTPGHPYRGLTLAVPTGSFSTAVDVRLRVSDGAILPSMPAGYRVDGPPLEIELDAPRSDSLMSLTVPVRHGPNEGVVIALYDQRRGALEVLPIVGETDSTIEVVTEHLRADLLLGPEGTSAAVRATGRGTAGRGVHLSGISVPNVSAEILRILHPLPQPTVAPVINPSTDGWPVVDHGSAAAPNGFRFVIPSLVVMMSNLRLSPRSSINAISTPGFYADAGILGALQDASRFPGMSALERLQFASYLARLRKDARDARIQRVLAASMALKGTPALVALYRENAGPTEDGTWYATTVASNSEGLSVSQASAPAPAPWRIGAPGLLDFLVKSVADGEPTNANAALPLSSFVYEFERMRETLGTIRQFENLPPLSRRVVNDALRDRLGLPRNPFRGRPFPGVLSASETRDVLPVRSDELRLVVPDSGIGVSVHAAQSGELLVTQADDGVDVAPLVGSDNGNAASVIATTFRRIGGLLRQIAPDGLSILRARFSVAPDTTRITADSLTVELEADVPSPPDDGFRLRWEWGDGNSSENLGLRTATHTYANAANYTVVAKLLSADGERTLAVDTVRVENVTSPHWRLTSMSDADGLGSAASVEVTVLLAGAVANPSSAMISIDSVPLGPVALQLRVLNTGTWTADNCCRRPLPPPLPGERRQRLGEQPTLTLGVGPFFAGFAESRWTQSTTDLSMGTITGQQTLGVFVYNVRNAGSQTGPQFVLRTEATRTGRTMTGTITLIFWPIVDVLPGETVRYVEEPDFYRFPFTAERIQ